METNSSSEEAAAPNGVGSATDQETTTAAQKFKTMSSKIHSFYTPGGACSFPERVTSIRMVSPPRQRQRWNDKQMLPHTNWGDLFFDLFYVAAAYNLGNILLSDPSAIGILYFIGLFGPIMAEWFTRMYFDSRFAFSDDPAHRLFELIHLCFLATAVVHIRTVDVMSNPSDYPDMFAYSLAMTLLAFLNICRNVEIFFFVDGEAAAKHVAKRDLVNASCQGVFYLAATIVSGLQYYGNLGSSDGGYDDGSHRSLFGTSGDDDQVPCSAIIGMVSSFAGQCGISKRFLAEASDHDSTSSSYESSKESYGYGETTTTNVPLWLCLGGYMYFLVHFLVMVLFCFPGGGRHKEVSVPMNIDFCIHRCGEWHMILLGESILSLVIVETSNSSMYYVTFYAGIISVILMQYLHFRSQPHHADEHALRRSKNAGVIFSTFMQLYSFALVAVGVSYKMLLYEYYYEDQAGYRLRRVLQYLRDAAMRRLAGSGGGSKYTPEERQQRVANFFCGSMAIAWICLDVMILTHHGIKSNVKRCECQRTKKISKLGVIFATIRVGLIVFIATLSQYVNDPELIAVIGMVSIIAQVLTRFLGDLVYPKAKVSSTDEDGEGDSEDGKWPNVTHARAKHADSNTKDEENGTGS